MKRTLTLFFFCLISSGIAWGQNSVQELQNRIRSLEDEIKNTNALLQRTEADRKNNRSQLQLVLKNIGNRKEIISSLDSQIRLINREVNVKTEAIERMQAELKELKSDYTAIVRAAYKSQQTNTVLTFLFASEDFNELTQRIFYIKRYTAMREKKAEQIDSVSRLLQTDITLLAAKRDSLSATVQNRNQELSKLADEERDYRRIDTSLSSQSRQYNQKIAEQQRQIKNAQDQIQRIIAEEARRSQTTQRSAAEEEAFVALTGRFDQNKGKLPYPVSGGVVIEKFGTHKDPKNPNVTVNQKGVKLAAERGAHVRAVFEGVVNNIMLLPGLGNTIIIEHGSYYTTYTNLETVAVKKGDKVSTNQMLGKIYSGDDAASHILQFSIADATKGTPVFVNPELWIKR